MRKFAKKVKRLKRNSIRKIKNIKNSKILLSGSLLIFFGVCILLFNAFLVLKDELYSEMKLSMMETVEDSNDVISDNNSTSNSSTIKAKKDESETKKIDYSKYFGVLEIPRISLKRGFYNLDSKYNNIKYNVTLVEGSQTPDATNGNLILMAHSGDSYISYFAYLYKLSEGDIAYVTYNNVKYNYRLVKKYDVDKNGTVTIDRNYDKSCLTLITCTKDDDYHQSVYIFERV